MNAWLLLGAFLCPFCFVNPAMATPERRSMTTATFVDHATAQQLADTWLSRLDAAQYLRVSEKTLANRRHDGPPYSRIFGRVAYRLDVLQAWSRQQQVAL